LKYVFFKFNPDIIIINLLHNDNFYLREEFLYAQDLEDYFKTISSLDYKYYPFKTYVMELKRRLKVLKRKRYRKESVRKIIEQRYKNRLEKITKISLEKGCKVILIKEPVSLEWNKKFLTQIRNLSHQIDIIAQKYHLQVVDLYPIQEELEKFSFLWWDQAHMTSYGYECLANEVLSSLAEALDTK